MNSGGAGAASGTTYNGSAAQTISYNTIGAAPLAAVATHTAGVQTTSSTVTFSATAMTINCALSNVFEITMTANVTTAMTMSNVAGGQTINVFIIQDATGSRTMTWSSSTIVKWSGGAAPTLSTAANSVDLLVMTYRSATSAWYATLTKGFA